MKTKKPTVKELQDEIKELKEVLRWAWDHLAKTQPHQYFGEYYLCAVCGMPEWDHAKDCELKIMEERMLQLQ